ncbi:DsbC family protein [Persephonella sp.]
MKIKNLSLGFLLFAFLIFTGYGSECEVEKDSVKKLQNKIGPMLGGGKVLEINKSPVEGLFEVIIEVGDRMIPIYVDCDMKYLISGEIIDIEGKRSLTKEKAMELAKNMAEKKAKQLEKILGQERAGKLFEILGPRITSIKLVDVKDIPGNTVRYGNKNAKYTIYVVSDPDCPYCRKFHKEMKEVLKKAKDVKFEIILFPLAFHKDAKKKAITVLCEKDPKKRTELLDKSMKGSIPVKKCEEGEKTVKDNLKFGELNGIRGTPAIIFPKGIVISGYMKSDKVLEILNALK